MPYGHHFRGAGGRSDKCSVKAWLNKEVLSLDLKTDREWLMRTVCGSEFQTDGAENWKARLEKSVLVNGLCRSRMADERRVWLQNLWFGDVNQWVVPAPNTSTVELAGLSHWPARKRRRVFSCCTSVMVPSRWPWPTSFSANTRRCSLCCSCTYFTSLLTASLVLVSRIPYRHSVMTTVWTNAIIHNKLCAWRHNMPPPPASLTIISYKYENCQRLQFTT